MAGSVILLATFRPRMALPRVAGAGLLGVGLGPAFVPALGFGLHAVVKSGLGLLPGATAGAGASSGPVLRTRTAPLCSSRHDRGAEDSADDGDADDDYDADEDYGSDESGVDSCNYKQRRCSFARAPSARAAAALILARNTAVGETVAAELASARQVRDAADAAFTELRARARRKSVRASAAHSGAVEAEKAAEEFEAASTAALLAARQHKRGTRKRVDDANFRAGCIEESDSMSSSSNDDEPPLAPPSTPGAGKKKRRQSTDPVLTSKYIRSLFKDEVDALIQKIDATAPVNGGRRDSVIKTLLGRISKGVSQRRQTQLEGHEKQIVSNVRAFLEHLKLTPRDRLSQHTHDIVLLSVCTVRGPVADSALALFRLFYMFLARRQTVHSPLVRRSTPSPSGSKRRVWLRSLSLSLSLSARKMKTTLKKNKKKTTTTTISTTATFCPPVIATTAHAPVASTATMTATLPRRSWFRAMTNFLLNPSAKKPPLPRPRPQKMRTFLPILQSR